ncbi:MAG: AMP-binding protein [Actinophytocola sp.]|nr:AMP-binding protein [Actinophytocola sp.]
MHFSLLPDLRAEERPDAACIADDSAQLTNAEFLTRVRAASVALRRRGVGGGDVVGVMLPNRLDLVVTLFAAWRLGAVVTPINPALTTDEAEYQITDSGAVVTIVDDHELSGLTMPTVELAADPDDAEPAVTPGHDRLALLIYTSGTTGRPKGVMLDHANLAAMCEMAISAVDLNETDHSLLVLPLFHVNGIVVSILSSLLARGRATIAGQFSPTTFFRTVERTQPTYFSAVPAIYAMLTALPEDEQPDTSSLRVAICGAAPMPPELIDRFELRYGVPIIEGYGLSEGTCASTINPIDGVRKPGTVGLPFPGQEVAVMDETGAVLSQGGTGEVVVRGPNVMRGYLNKPDATAKTIVDDWLHTGDVGYFDEDGYLVLVDRIKDMIIRGGENIYPKEIETVLYRHPGVLEAAVVGAPHDVLGEVPLAFVSTRPETTVTADELHELCRESLSKYKLPDEIRFVGVLPKNPVGKIDKPSLRSGLTDISLSA